MAELKPTAPPYPDILLENTVITDEIKYNVMTKRWNDVHLFQFPARSMYVVDAHQPRCAGNEYPRNPAYANQPQNTMPLAVPMSAGVGFIGGPAGTDGFVGGVAAGYMMGQGGMGMLSGVDGGPRMAIGGNYVGL